MVVLPAYGYIAGALIKRGPRTTLTAMNATLVFHEYVLPCIVFSIWDSPV